MPPTSVGHFLLNDVLPASHAIHGPITNKGLHDHVVGLAKSHPEVYVTAISALKRRGDEIATLEGVSVGLDDITPAYGARDALLAPHYATIAAAKTPEARANAVAAAQQDLLAHTKLHPGSMTHMALSGARGNPGQLMKIVATPLAAVHPRRGIDPFLLRHSYAEGLSPAEYWVTMPEVRANEVQARISVAEPGEMAKVLVNNMVGQVVTVTDCGTTAGLKMALHDAHVLDRHAQADQGVARNTLVTPQLVHQLEARGVTALLVRSPMTCAATHGVCQLCQGLNEKGQTHRVGTNVGVRAAQALAEPLTQMALSARHGGLLVKGAVSFPTGLKGVRQLLEVPLAFKGEAVLAPHDGVVTRIEVAPQGGHYVHLDGDKLYAKPELTVTTPVGAHVEAGDALTNGIPHPIKVVAAKGLGAGRAYFVEALHKVYAAEGVNLDKRHLELLAKSEMNHVRLLDHDPRHPELMKGDVINYNAFRAAYAAEGERVALADAIGQRLGADLLHHTVGTRVTPTLAHDLKGRGVREVVVARHLPEVEFVMKPFAQNPLLEPDWMARLAHRQLKGTLQTAAATGGESDLHGTHVVPAYAYGAELRHGPEGTY